MADEAQEESPVRLVRNELPWQTQVQIGSTLLSTEDSEIFLDWLNKHDEALVRMSAKAAAETAARHVIGAFEPMTGDHLG